MTGDFSRIRFDASKQYTGVLEQQGRVRLDSDANEQLAVSEYLRRTEIRDVIGEFGGPEDNCGFAISVQGNDILIGAGRYYVEGLLVELANPVTYNSQQFLIEPDLVSGDLLRRLAAAGTGIALQLWLQVWQRVVTPLDDPSLNEPAIGQADTTLRLQTVARVVGRLSRGSANLVQYVQAAAMSDTVMSDAKSKEAAYDVASAKEHLASEMKMYRNPAVGNQATPAAASAPAPTAASAPAPAAAAQPDCCSDMYAAKSRKSTGKLSVSLQSGADSCGCDPVWSSGYRGLENQLYRVQVHTGGNLGTATFKWSRENGSVAFAVTGVQGQVIQLASLPKDENLGLKTGDWVELIDDTYLFGDTPNQPGQFYVVHGVDENNLTVTVTTTVSPVDTTRNARLQRWDQSGTSASWSGVPITSAAVPLEDGIQVNFSAGLYQSGDYWTIPARSASGQLLWPPNGGPAQQSPASMHVYEAPLACIRLSANATQYGGNILELESMRAASLGFAVSDCRLTFPPLTDLASNTVPAAMHVTATSWTNDSTLTVDEFLSTGLSVTFDSPTTCPWSGGNFQVTLEVPVFPYGSQNGFLSATTVPPLFRQVYTLEAPNGFSTSGDTVSWMTPSNGQVLIYQRPLYYLATALNYLLNPGLATQTYGRLRVRLPGASVFNTTSSGTAYLDGRALGTGDVQSSLGVTLPTGDGEVASDFESWFYLSPSLAATGVSVSPTLINYNETVGYHQGVNFTNAQGQVVAGLVATVTLNYAPASNTIVHLILSGNTGVGTVVSIPSTATVLAGHTSVQVNLSMNANPGNGVTDNFNLTASVAGILGTIASPPGSFQVAGHQQTIIG